MFQRLEIVSEIFCCTALCTNFVNVFQFSRHVHIKQWRCPVLIHDDLWYSTELQASGAAAGGEGDVKLKRLSLVKPKLATLGSPSTERATAGDRVGN